MLTRKALAAVTVTGSNEENILVFDDAPEFMNGHAVGPLDSVELNFKAAQEQLLELRLQQEAIERQKQQLEALRIKQERFVTGKRDLLEKLSRFTSRVECELDDTHKRAEELVFTHDECLHHLKVLQSLQPEKWQRSQVYEELDHALAAIDDADSAFTQGMRLLQAQPTVESHLGNAKTPMVPSFTANSDHLLVWLRRGFSFTLPLMVSALIAIVLIRVIF